MIRLLLLASFVLSAAASAQTAGTCAVGQSRATLDRTDLRAGLYNTGTLFYRSSGSEYEVPRGSGRNAIYEASLWVGGTVGGEFRTAGATFGQGGDGAAFEFWPGPLTDDGTLPNPADCSAYDRIYVVTQADVDAYNDGAAPTSDLAAWPVGLGASTVDAAGDLVVPTSRDQTIDLAAGERPLVFGTQTAFWVMNDVGGEHQSTGSAPLGVEVQVTAFVVDGTSAAVDQASFYRYRVVNRTRQPIEDVRLTWWMDTDIGGGGDEYQGVDLGRSLAYTYNDADDAVYAIPPATGVDFLDGTLGTAMYARNGDANRHDPRTAEEYGRMQRGLWPDGTPLTALGGGYDEYEPLGPDASPGEVAPPEPDTTVFAFPGDPLQEEYWSELNADTFGDDNTAGNKRSIPSTTPFRLAPGEAYDLRLAFLFAQGTSNLNSVTKLRAASDLIQSMYDRGTLFADSRFATASEVDGAAGLGLAVAPNPSAGRAGVTVTLPESGDVRLRVVDALGREVAVLADEPWAAGTRTVEFGSLAPGVYAVVLDASGRRETRRFTVVR